MKYGNKKTTVNGITFDSKKEAKYYTELLALMAADVVTNIKIQPRYTLQDSYKKNGKVIRKIEYVADFEVTYTDGHIEIVDVKGVKTDVYRLKKKLFEYKYPNYKIVEV